MSATIDTQYWMALKATVTLAARGVPVHWPGEAFAPPTTATGLLPFIAVGDDALTLRDVIDDDASLARTGILSLAYVAPLGYTHEWYIQQASGLLPYFRPNGIARFQSACLRWGNGTAVPRVERGYQDGGYFRTPVIIPWRSAA